MNSASAEIADWCGLRHIYMVLGMFRTVLNIVVFWLRWQWREPNRTVTLRQGLKTIDELDEIKGREQLEA